MRAVRVVFDTNIFSEGPYEILIKSPFARLCRRGRIVPLYGHVLIEETLRAYASEAKREFLVNDWLPFIALTSCGLLNDFEGLIREELVAGRGKHTSIYMDKTRHENFKSNIRQIPLDGSWEVWGASKADRDEDERRRNEQRRIAKVMREEVATKRREFGLKYTSHPPPPFAQFVKPEMEMAGRDLIPAFLGTSRASAIADRWSRSMSSYPYFTTCVRDMIYMAYYAMTRPNQPIDSNAQADLNLMAHLLNADVLVSNEEGFLKTAFDDLWRPVGKVRMSATRFVDYIERL